MSLWGSLVHDEWETLLIGGTYTLPDCVEDNQGLRKGKTKGIFGGRFYRKKVVDESGEQT